MRALALSLLILCELLLILLWKLALSSSALSLISTLIVVVFLSFLFSAITSKIKSIPLSRNYAISGVLGVFGGILFYFWAKDNFVHLTNWIENYGRYLLLSIIFICALILYFFKGNKSEKSEQDYSKVNN